MGPMTAITFYVDFNMCCLALGLMFSVADACYQPLVQLQ